MGDDDRVLAMLLAEHHMRPGDDPDIEEAIKGTLLYKALTLSAKLDDAGTEHACAMNAEFRRRMDQLMPSIFRDRP